MGGSRYSDVDWSSHVRSSYAGKSTHEVFKSRTMDPSLDPAKVGYRECRDSAANPEALPIILASDVTGSMGHTADLMIREHLGATFRMLYDRRPIADPQILCAAIGDATIDEAPLQVTQFEADGVALAIQLEKVWLEKGGGGNGGESYTLLWAWAAYRTKVDAFKKRRKKGYIFTVGDEAPLPTIEKQELEKIGFERPQGGFNSQVLLRHVQNDWNVFHIIINPVPGQDVEGAWRALLGNNVIMLQDLAYLPLGVTATIEKFEGRDAKAGRSSTDLAVVSDVVDAMVV